MRLASTLALLATILAAGLWLWGSGPSSASFPTPPEASSRQQLAGSPALGPAVAAPRTPPVASAPLLGLSELLQRPPSAQLRWIRFKANPAIVVIEYPTLREQGLAMNRLAAMFEKRASHGDRVLSEGELAELMRKSGDTVATFYLGHDYPGQKVARFFSQAEAQHVALNAQEMRLRSLMLEVGLMKPGARGGMQAIGEQAVISFTGVQDDPSTAPSERIDSVSREAILRHELSHGVFFVDPAYRAHCMKFWRDVLTRQERKTFSAYLKSLEYNPGDEELMANETQAYLMHTPDSRAFSADSLGVSEPALANLRIRFRAGEPAYGLRD
jgi:hypothetical protein